ncbi:long-chain-fatty-acid--CoA ligase [Sphingomonas sp. RP10(2022)]|uniref:3-methylmercaptopropionyl-CoA ligase n=1 Tax=Sphingomonas liriopis TaxID=2949094 RepID=A0A9X2KPU9_9SPHN|nr:long-chain-fatty-acid--CoA ligase [Sphingomonas liriopis]MCP3734292.1 long-chain-fatty-acid--CoA ligase [Sphingomonas liriopis]
MSHRFVHFGEVAEHHARERPDAIAFAFEGRTTSFGDFAARCRRVAVALSAEGCRPGARVAFLGKNSDLFFELLVGAGMAGLVTVPLNWRLAPAEHEQILADAGAELLFVTGDFLAAAARLVPNVAGIRRLIAIEPGDDPDRHFTAWRDAPGDAAGTTVDVGRDDVFLQLYTSGTTGRPKGVMLTHGAILGALELAEASGEAWRRWTPDLTALVAMPVFHVSGSGWALGAFHGGGRSVVLREFSIAGIERAIAGDGVTHAMIVPTALQMLVDSWEQGDVRPGSLRQIVYGASPMPPVLLKRCLKLIGCDFVQYYGMTETCGSFVALPPEDHVRPVGNRLASTGRVMSGNAIRIVDLQGAEVPPSVVGEVCVRTPGVMAGYWNMPEATRETIDADGWLRTGDAGYLDADGYLFLCDRIKDMIISGGENIYPIEVEQAIATHPAVDAVAVIGIPDDRWGETVKAFVVLKPGAAVNAEELVAHARTTIAGYKVPRSVDFVATLPRNASGKILKRELRAAHRTGPDRAPDGAPDRAPDRAVA